MDWRKRWMVVVGVKMFELHIKNMIYTPLPSTLRMYIMLAAPQMVTIVIHY